MRLKAILSGILGLALAGPTFGDPQAGGQESFPEGGEGVAEEPEVDVAAKLEEIIEDMKQAERDLAGIGDWRATDAQGRAIEELSRLFDGGRKRQDSAIQSLEQLIKAASEKSGKSGEQQDPSRSGKAQQSTKLTEKQTSGNPAKEIYDSKGNPIDRPFLDRVIDPGSRWGGLPPRLRDELSQADDEFRSLRGDYKAKLMEYSKIMSQE